MVSTTGSAIKTLRWSLGSHGGFCRRRAPAAARAVPSALVTSSPDPSTPAASGPVPPPPLLVAVSLAALEAAVLVLYGLSLLPSLEGERLAMGASTVLFFAVYGGFLGYCAVQLY